MTGEEIRGLVLDPRERNLCQSRACPNEDGYCPKFNCLIVRRLGKLTIQQWDGIAKQCEKEGDFEIERIVELAKLRLRNSGILARNIRGF